LLTVSSGGSATSTSIHSGGSAIIESGGSAIFASIDSGGVETVMAGAVTENVSVFGELDVDGAAFFVDVSNGVTLSVGNGGSVNNAFISSGGIETINAGGSDGGAIIIGGEQDVAGVAIGTEVNGGVQIVEAGGVASATFLGDGSQIVLAGGMSISAHGGGIEIIDAGGTASFTAIGGTEIVEAGGVDVGATVGGGEQDVYGSALGTIVNGGLQIDGRQGKINAPRAAASARDRRQTGWTKMTA
jgi:autotransporter passenger strand-loop-strand repeat protein